MSLSTTQETTTTITAQSERLIDNPKEGLPVNTLRLAAAAVAVILLIPTTAEARHTKHHRSVQSAQSCTYDNDGKTTCPSGAITWNTQQQNVRDQRVTKQARSHISGVATVAEEGVRFIPNPAGTWRVARSCAHRLAAYWGLGKGLDEVREWVRRFPRVGSPSVGVAAVRRDQHHIMGIIGGSPGAWRVADFNSGGHLNREYTVADFRGYFFVKPTTRVAVGW